MADLSQIAKNAKKIKQQIADEAGLKPKDINDSTLKEVSVLMDGAKKVADQEQDPSQIDPAQLKQLAGGEAKKESAEELSNQKKIAYVLATIAPTILGYTFGGAEGGAQGAKASGEFLKAAGAQEAEAAKDSREMAQKKELKEMDIAARKEESEARREDRKANAGVANEMAAMRMQALRESMLERAEKKAYSKSTQGKLEKLGIEGKQRIDNSKLGYIAVQGMADALLRQDQNTFSPIGDNDYTQQLSLFEEALGRMQSGGAITVDEVAKFKKMAPTFRDSPEIQRKKLKQLQGEFSSRMGTMGFTPEELGVASVNIDDLKVEKKGGVKNPALPSAQAGQEPDFDSMSDEELKKYLGQ